ncbi:MAG: OmpA family protein [Bacteroidales bacterium]
MMNNFRTYFTITAILLVLSSWSSVAQEDVRIKRRLFNLEDTEGFKTAWKNVRQGDKLFEKGNVFYKEALEYYEKAARYNNDNAALNYKMGACYLVMHQNEQAIEAFNKALAKDDEIAADIYYLLGKAYHHDYQFENAISNYQKCLENDLLKKMEMTKEEINIAIRQCNKGIELMKEPVRVNINNLGEKINSEHDDYGPVLSPDDSVLYFTSRRKTEDNNKLWLGDEKYYSNIFKSEKKNGEWQDAEKVEGKVNSSDHNAVVEITEDPYRMYIYRSDKNGGDIYYSEKKDDKWKRPKKFSRILNTKYKESSMSFTSDETGVYFISNMEDETNGGKDIFYSELNEKDKWKYPKNMGGSINTKLNEEGVFINSTGDKLYFSSEGMNSMGGYDIFYTERDADGRWKEPQNLGYPLNTPYDDVLFQIIDEKGKKAYFSSRREDSFGGLDIYEVIFLGEAKDLFTTEAVDLISWENKPDSSILFRTPEKLPIDTTLYLGGKVIDSTTNKGVEAKLQLIDNEQGKIISTYITDSTGKFSIKLPEQKKYGIEVTAKDYLFFADNINPNKMEAENDTISKNFYLDKMEVGKTMILKNIYFETNSAKLKSESYPELERVANLLKENPSIKLEISGHTDNVGSYVANKKLSEDRAESVVDYLIGQGVDRDRLKYVGHSFTKPVASNDTPEGRQKNRRVEFEILEK